MINQLVPTVAQKRLIQRKEYNVIKKNALS